MSTGVPAGPEIREVEADEGVDGVFIVESDTTGPVQTSSCPEYAVFPPADGEMAHIWANCGFYTKSVSPPHAVHSLFNGAIWITYDPELESAAVDVIRSAAIRSGHILASPTEGLGAPIVLTAWQRQLWLDDVDDQRFDDFINTYVHSPNGTAQYQPCRDGQGRPRDSLLTRSDR